MLRSTLVLFLAAIWLVTLAAGADSEDPQCGPNTYIGCEPGYCGQECNADKMLSARIRCPHACIHGGCRCIEGFCYDTDKKECVKPVAKPTNDPDCEDVQK